MFQFAHAVKQSKSAKKEKKTNYQELFCEMSRSMLPPQVYDCESHPYGVRPPGNAYLADAALGNVRLQGL